MKRLMTVQDLPALRTASDPQISPDGARIAFVVRTMDVARNGYSSHIWVVPMDGGAGRHAGASPWTGGADNDGSPRWSPDSGTLAFAGRRGTPGDQVFLLTAGGEPRPVTDLPPGRVSELAWSPDGSRIAVRFQRQVEVWTDAAAEERRRLHHSQPPRVITRLGYRAEGEGYVTDSHPAHLLVVDLAAQATRAVTTGGRDCGSFCWSPDGARIAYAVNAAADPDLMPKAQGVHILSVADPATVTPLDVPLGPKIGLAWSPDGTMIAYLGHADAEEVWDVVNMHPWVASPSGGARDLMPDCDLHFGGASLSDIAGGGSCGPHWMPDSRSLLALAAEGGAMALWRVPVGGVGAVRMLGGGAQSILGVTLDATGETAALLAGDPARPGEISALSLSGRPRRLTRLSDAPLGGVALSAPAAFRARSPEGHDVPCWAFFPPRPAPDGGRPPAVLFLHGGPQMMHLNVLSHEIQLLAAQGYVVLTLDPRGAKGHGQAWTQALKGQWGAPACADVLACVDHAVQQEWVDPRRLGGRSSGTCPTPSNRSLCGLRSCAGMGSPSMRISPELSGRMPASASRSSDCPLPATPATPRISPSRNRNDTPSMRATPRSSRTTRFRASSAIAPGCAGPFSILKMTLRPTIASASSGGEDFAVSNVATISPRRMTDTRSVRFMISRNLWVMKMIVLFSRLSTRSISNNWSASAGVRTAVGSSSTRISAPRTSAFRISTRC